MSAVMLSGLGAELPPDHGSIINNPRSAAQLGLEPGARVHDTGSAAIASDGASTLVGTGKARKLIMSLIDRISQGGPRFAGLEVVTPMQPLPMPGETVIGWLSRLMPLDALIDFIIKDGAQGGDSSAWRDVLRAVGVAPAAADDQSGPMPAGEQDAATLSSALSVDTAV